MSKISKKIRETKHKSMGDHKKFLTRITKTLYYGKLPQTDSLSLPVTELAAELFSESQRGRSLDRLHCNDAAVISRNACVSPCSLVLALLYLEKLKKCNPEYLQRTAPSELFLVSLMVSSKFLYDDGEEDEVFTDEWAASGGLSVKELNQIEKDFLNAIDWNVYVQENNFWNKLKTVERAVAKRQGLNRGWFTYTELDSLLEFLDVYSLLQCVVCFSVVFIVTYAASVLTILGSMFIVSNIPGTQLQLNNPVARNQTPIITTLLEDQPQIMESNDVVDLFEDDEKDHCKAIAKPMDATNMFKTGIILASIQIQSSYNNSEGTPEMVSWDWWQSPLMCWLSKTSKIFENVKETLLLKYEDRYMESSVTSVKKLELEDQIHKATKLRMQEQLERSWHKEWTDSLRETFAGIKLVSYFLSAVKF